MILAEVEYRSMTVEPSSFELLRHRVEERDKTINIYGNLVHVSSMLRTSTFSPLIFILKKSS